MFSCEFCEISKNTFITEQLQWLLLEERKWVDQEIQEIQKMNHFLTKKSEDQFLSTVFSGEKDGENCPVINLKELN